MKLILFDFDGTLTSKDSFIQFLLFSSSKFRLFKTFLKFFLPIIGFKLGFYSGDRLKNKLINELYQGQSEVYLKQLGEQFSKLILPSILRTEILEKLKQYGHQGHEVCVVSASLDIYLNPFSERHNVKVICTQLQFIDGIYTGNFAKPNCNFKEKSRRIQEVYDLALFEEIIAYGNSKGDEHMFKLASRVVRV